MPLPERVIKSDSEWQASLTPEQYFVLRHQGTEPPFTCLHNEHTGAGMYCCVGCGAPLFDASAKYDSCTGWPSFSQTLDPTSLTELMDYKLPFVRKEIRCTVCDGHLGHVFRDGPPPMGLRYCINGTALRFVPKEAAEKTKERK